MAPRRPFRLVLALLSLVLAASVASSSDARKSRPAPKKPGSPAVAAAAATRGPTATRTTPVPPRQRSRPRSGPAPCLTPDPGFGAYTTWIKLPMGQMIAPKKGGLTKDGRFDLVVHFHGHEPARKEFVKTARGQVLVGIDLGIGSGAYERAFEDPARFRNLVAQVEQEMARRNGRERARADRIALSSWSAGYGAIWRILMQPAGRGIDALVLLDSVHAGYVNGHDGALKPWQIEPFVAYAKRAAAGERFLFLSHSAIQPPGYASTREVAEAIIRRLGSTARETAPRQGDPLGLELYARFDRGNLHVRGYGGNDKPDHCAHLGLIADVMKVHIVPRWRVRTGR